MPMPRTTHIVAIYAIDRAYGGPEEGGWWYDTGTLERIVAIRHSEEGAFELARRADRLLSHIERDRRDIGSMAYGGERHAAEVFETTAPRFFPEERPHYE